MLKNNWPESRHSAARRMHDRDNTSMNNLGRLAALTGSNLSNPRQKRMVTPVIPVLKTTETPTEVPHTNPVIYDYLADPSARLDPILLPPAAEVNSEAPSSIDHRTMAIVLTAPDSHLRDSA